MFDWVYLCCNRWMLDLFLETLPPIDSLRQVVVVANADIGEVTDPRCRVVRYDGPTHPYSLYVKLDLCRFTDIDFLYTDDDVICLRDPAYLGTAWCTGSHLDRLGTSARDFGLCQMISDACGYDFTPVDVGCDAGIYFMKHELKDEFNRCVHKFFEHKLFNLVYEQPRGNWYRTIDQRIMSGFFNAHEYKFIKSTQDIKVIYSMQSTIIKKRAPTFYHYGCSSHKREAWQLLRDYYVESTQAS
jgi:hypothetical protein